VKPRVAVLVSGGGRSLENLAARVRAGDLAVELALVVSSAPEAQALERARRLDLPTLVVSHREHPEPEDFSRLVFDGVEQARCDLVVLAGFLRRLAVPAAWRGRVINIHPSLLPKFGGKGFYGMRVHRAVLAAGEAETGCTVHHVTAEYDAGPPILQRRIAVRPGETAEELAARVFEEEKLALPEAIRRVLAALPSRSAAGDRAE